MYENGEYKSHPELFTSTALSRAQSILRKKADLFKIAEEFGILGKIILVIC